MCAHVTRRASNLVPAFQRPLGSCPDFVEKLSPHGAVLSLARDAAHRLCAARLRGLKLAMRQPALHFLSEMLVSD
jgi:hypothetical protein